MNTLEEESGGRNESPQADAAQPAPWQEIETGRYQPRRIRGSCLGRELG